MFGLPICEEMNMKKPVWFLVVVVIGMLVLFFLPQGCSSGVGTSNGGSRFRSCESIGFSSQSVADIYNSALVDRDYGNSHDEERWVAANSCASSCYYEAVCANGCTSCAYDIIDAAYSKIIAPPAKSTPSDNSTIGITIENIISSN